MTAPGSFLVTVDEDARRRFERAWRDGRPEPIERFLPPPDHPLYLPTLQELVQIELEFAWKQRGRAGAAAAARPPLVEPYLERFPRLNEAAIVRRLLRQEWQVRRAAGDRPSLAELQARFPQAVGDGRDLAPPAETAGDADDREPLPDRLGRYQVLGRLGAGGMGVVCRAHDPGLGRDVAVKVPRFHGPEAARAAARQRFLREARAAAAVRHPNVCPIFDVGEDAGRPFVVMALIEGEPLAERLRRLGRFEGQSEAAALAGQVADALAAVHAAHVVHRDVKPGNILLDRAGQPFLSDFGLAFAEDSEHLTATGVLLGTPAYLAPEQAAPDLGPVGAAADQYSLGVVLYQMLTGRLPFEGGFSSLIFQIGTRAVPPPSRSRPGLDPELEAICLKALAKEPARRFRSMQEFADALRGYARRAGQRPAPGVGAAPAQAGYAPQPGPLPEGAETHRLHLAARHHLEKLTEEGHRKSIATYVQVLDQDPTYALAWARLAFAYHLLSVRGYAAPTDACPRAKSAALQALALDKSLGEASVVLAAIQMDHDWDLAGAERAFRRALERKPNDAVAHQLHGKCLACLGRHAEAIVALRRAQELDPLSAVVSTSLGRHGFFLARLYDQAVRQYHKALETDPTFVLTHRFLGWAYLFQGKTAEGVAAMEAARQLHDEPLTCAGLGYAYAVSVQQAKARAILDDLTELAKQRYVAPDCQALVCIGLGDRDQAFAWLERVLEGRSEWFCKARVSPVLDPLRSDPRFDALLRRMNVKP
jgi:tetratricopeptide (TPR) repeat protein